MATSLQWRGLSESFEVDSWVVKVRGQSGILYFKNTIYKEMPGGDFRQQPATFDNPVMAICFGRQSLHSSMATFFCRQGGCCRGVQLYVF